MQRLMQDARQMLREMPWIGVLFLITLVCCLRLHAAVISQADAEQLRFVAKRGQQTKSHREVRRAKPANCEGKAQVPGFKVSVGWMEYSVELNVPTQCMHAILDDARTRLTRRIHPLMRNVA